MEILARCLIAIFLILLSFICISRLFFPNIFAIIPRVYQKYKANRSADKAGQGPQDRHGHFCNSPEYFRPRAQSPYDLFMALGNTHNPCIDPTDAMGQINRIAETRNLSPEQKIKLAVLVGGHIEMPQWDIFSGPRVNVIELNAAIDSMFRKSTDEGGDHN